MKTNTAEKIRLQNIMDHNRRQLKFLRSLPASPVTEAVIRRTEADIEATQNKLKCIEG